MRKIHSRKRKIRQTESLSIDCGNTFSVRNVVMSALFNLFDDYGALPSYFIALGEFIDFSEFRVATEQYINAHKTLSVSTSDLEDVCDADDIARLFRRKEATSRAKKAIKEIGGMVLSKVSGINHFFKGAVAEISPIDNVVEFFSLSEKEARVLAFLACWSKPRYFDSLCDDVAEGRERAEVLKFLARSIQVDIYDANATIRKFKEKKVVDGGRRHFPDLADEIEEFVFEYDGGNLARKFSSVLETEKVFPTDSFEADKADIEIISKLLREKNGTHILFHGKPGSGKTEFAKSIAKELGKDIFVPARNDEKKNSLSPVKIAATLFAARNGNGIALIDEADDFLETEQRGFFGISGNNTEKGRVNTLMDESRSPAVWITNSIAGIDESTRRRFAYTLEFSGVSDRQKRIVLDAALRENKVSESLSDDIFSVVREYSLSPAGIALSVKNAKIVSGDSEASFLENVRRIAKSHCALISGKTPVEKALTLDSRFDESLFNTVPTIDEISRNIGNYCDAVRQTGKILPIAMLFSGAPGTGKTQFGRYIAKQLEKEILIKRMSDIKHPYVGMTEKNIAAAFREAEHGGKILMIDEADTLFLDRRTAHHSWESSETNEILAQMECFKGIFICTTNLLENFDPAAMRRFHWKIEFRPLSAEGRVKTFRCYFPQLEVAADTLLRELKPLEGICPGDFNAVKERLRYDAFPTAEKVFEALRIELRYKQNESRRAPIGFV